MIKDGAKLGGAVIDEGYWWDVGTRESYLQLHRDLPELDFPRYPTRDRHWCATVHPTARMAEGVELRGCSVVSAGANIGAGAILEDSLVWRGAEVAAHSHLSNCVVRMNRKAEGILRDADL